MKTLRIIWLGQCNNCGFDEYLSVKTERGIGCWLFDGDLVECPECEASGVIECEDNVAHVCWGLSENPN